MTAKARASKAVPRGKKHLYFAEAERLYVVEQHTLAEIASSQDVSERTLSSWKAEGDWETKRANFLKSKQGFHEELYELARTIMRKINEDLAENKEVSASRLYTLKSLLPQLTKVKDYEAAVHKDREGEKKQLDDDIFSRIRKEVLGLE